jgi:hypothetical protein
MGVDSDPAVNHNNRRAARPYFEAAGTGLQIEIHRTGYVERSLERTFRVGAKASPATQDRGCCQEQKTIPHVLSPQITPTVATDRTWQRCL